MYEYFISVNELWDFFGFKSFLLYDVMLVNFIISKNDKMKFICIFVVENFVSLVGGNRRYRWC